MASMVGNDLSGIRAVKPNHLEEGHDGDESKLIAVVPDLPASNDSAGDDLVSDAFELMLAQVRKQYLIEMAQMHSQIEQLITDKNGMEDDLEVLRSENEELKSPKMVNADKNSDEFGRPLSGEGLPGLNQAMVRQHQNLRELNADQILDKFELEEKETVRGLFKDRDMRKMVQESPTMTSENDEEREERMGRMSRCEAFAEWLQSNTYEMIMAICLCVNVVWMAIELQIYGMISGHAIGVYAETISSSGLKDWEVVFLVGDIFFTVLFGTDVLVRILMLRLKFWKFWMNYIDVGVSATSLIEVTVFYATSLPVNPVLFRLLRIGKLARAFRMVTMTSVLASLQLLVKCLISSSNMLFWSFCLLTFVQCVAGLIISTLCSEFISQEGSDLSLREEVFRYYGTFSRTFLTMFEIMFANWGPPCRVLVENISEWFAVFFLAYRCVLGFAVLNIINAVFVQQSIKTATSDEELAFKQKEKDIQSYTRKVKKLFQTMDASGDGAINLQEFSKLVKSPKLKFWMGQLELEYHDLLSLFEFLDNGDGEITLMEFIDGASRLRGSAKAIDVWRLETKLEVYRANFIVALQVQVLFEEVINLLQLARPGSPSTTVQGIFNKSTFSHIRCNQIVRQVS